jgi:hypothetical protein
VARSTALLCSSGATLHSIGIDPARPPRQAPGNRWRWPPRAHQPKAITDVDPKIGSRRSSLNSPAQSEHATAIKAAYPQVSVPSSLHLVCDAPPHPSKAASRLATVRLSSGTFEALAHVAVVTLTCADATRGPYEHAELELEIVLGVKTLHGFKSRILRHTPAQTLPIMIDWWLVLLRSVSVAQLGPAAYRPSPRRAWPSPA